MQISAEIYTDFHNLIPIFEKKRFLKWRDKMWLRNTNTQYVSPQRNIDLWQKVCDIYDDQKYKIIHTSKKKNVYYCLAHQQSHQDLRFIPKVCRSSQDFEDLKLSYL
jgi:hypothetical protein